MSKAMKGWAGGFAGFLAVVALSRAASAAPDNALLTGAFQKAQALAGGAKGLEAADLNGDIGDALNAAKQNKPAGNSFDTEAALAALDENKIGIAARFIAVQPGTFLMGRPAGECEGNEVSHKVTLTRGYEMQATPVTQLQYLLVTGTNPAVFHRESDCGKDAHKVIAGIEVCVDNPVESVSWYDAQGFIERLNAIQKEYVYRLPTEAEWEKAAKEGGAQGGAWTWENSGGRTHPVATQTSNPLGLYDMQGNVWEWTQDWDGDYPKGAVTDPQGPATGGGRVFRGGSFSDSPAWSRPEFRFATVPDARDTDVGFRLARVRR